MVIPSVRVRFAPAPTGLMHLGNIRTALMNYLFAQQRNGTFVLRIEDTDSQRNFDPHATQIMSDLAWLNILHDEGPKKNELYAPYFQSQRTPIYQKYLDRFINKGDVYRCFCTSEDLEKKRLRQVALKQPPRYDRTCLQLPQDEIDMRVAMPFVWRAKLDHTQTIELKDLAREIIRFEMHNFSDPVLTREDGSFTFLFANFVDDVDMKITHIFRGEDHLSNTGVQAALFKMIDAPLPIYWNMPILCNIEGKKLSKRDFGFSLNDLRTAGYLPHAICNYLAIIGGGTFDKEIMTMDELIKHINFDHIHATGQVKYDVEKLNWMNHEWISKLDLPTLVELCIPFIQASHPEIRVVEKSKIESMIRIIQPNLRNLGQAGHLVDFYFNAPHITKKEITQYIEENPEAIMTVVAHNMHLINTPAVFIETIKAEAKKSALPLKHLFALVRLALTGTIHGPSIAELIEMLGIVEAEKRLKKVLTV